VSLSVIKPKLFFERRQTDGTACPLRQNHLLGIDGNFIISTVIIIICMGGIIAGIVVVGGWWDKLFPGKSENFYRQSNLCPERMISEMCAHTHTPT
jgi:hypothetical protein